MSVGAITLNDKLALPVGTTNLTIIAVKVNPQLSATVNARVYDNCGNGRQFDPVLAQVTVAAGGEVRQGYSGIPAAEHYVCVANGSPGLSRVKLVVNGRTFEVNPLEDGKAWVVDVRAAMNEGKQNTVVLIGWGVPGASADLQISDRAIGTLLALAAKVERPVLSLVRTGDQVVLSWLAPANFFTLEASDSFGAVWQAVSAAQEETEGLTTVRTGVQHGKTFFRLRQ